MSQLQVTAQIAAYIVWVSIWVSDADWTNTRLPIVIGAHMVEQTLTDQVFSLAERAVVCTSIYVLLDL